MAIAIAIALALAFELGLEQGLKLAPWSWPPWLRTIAIEHGDGSCRWRWRAVTTLGVWPMVPVQPRLRCRPG